MKKDIRVVITGIGVVAPNALGVQDFRQALWEGRSGVKFWEDSKERNLKCQVGGVPPVTQAYKESLLPDFFATKIKNKGIIYGCLAGIEAWKNAGLPVSHTQLLKEAGIIFGSGALGLDSTVGDVLMAVNEGNSRSLGSRVVPECMNSGAAAYLNQLIGFGNRAYSNSSACITGSEAVFMGYEHLKAGRAKVMLCGSTEGDGRYIWAAFDAMRVLCSDSNDRPEFASRPMSDSSAGFVPAGGSGALVLETLDSALERGATIYAEVLGGAQNTGGLRNGGSMTAPNSEVLVACIEQAAEDAGIEGHEVDLIAGHLTSTKADPTEIQNWMTALKLTGDSFPLINTPKSMIGHCIAGAGSIELVACVLQLRDQFVHKNMNVTEDTMHPEIKKLIPSDRIPLETVQKEINVIMKANFGFGDLNCSLVLKKWH